MASVFNAYLAYRFIKILTSKWEDTDAYASGVVDASGNQLKKTGDLKTSDEKKSYTIFHKIIFNIKRLLQRFPGGKSRIASYAAALSLLRESTEVRQTDKDILENILIEHINKLEETLHEKSLLTEEIANSVGTGAALGNFIQKPFTFAGMKGFKVTSDAYNKFLHGKKKYARWDKFLRREDATEIREYIKKNPKAKVVLQDETHGSMVIMVRDL
tara:strand:- start:1545 stop:2189 length:645 start_codon:yes stop_codon:yes gene_type:complete